jgi:hypothetical protein
MIISLGKEIKGKNNKKTQFMARFLGSSNFEITVIPPTKKISESSSNGIYRNTDEVRWRNGISRVNCASGR